MRSLAIGDQVEQFRLVEPAGCGKWIAERSQHFQQRVLIEIAPGAVSEQAQQRIQDRIRLLSRLRHSSIPGLLQSGMLDTDSPFAIFEFSAGTSLVTWVKEKHLPVREAIRLACECVDGLAAAHGQLVAHGALHSDRFLMDDAGHPRLPEFPLDDARQDPVRDDLKQIAEVLAELLNAAEGSIPPDLKRILTRSRGEAGNSPYQSCAALADDLSRFLNYRPLSGSARYSFHRLKLFARRRPGLFYPISLSGLALLLALTYSLGMEYRARASQREAESRLRDLHQLTASLESNLYESVRRVPNSKPAQESLIRWSEESLDRLAIDADGDPTFRRELAGDYSRLAQACEENGLVNDAARLNRKAAAVLQPPAARP